MGGVDEVGGVEGGGVEEMSGVEGMGGTRKFRSLLFSCFLSSAVLSRICSPAVLT